MYTNTQNEEFNVAVAEEFQRLSMHLQDKNETYNSAAFRPAGIMSRQTILEQLKVLIDNKLARLRAAFVERDGENIAVSSDKDLVAAISYMVMYRVQQRLEREARERQAHVAAMADAAGEVALAEAPLDPKIKRKITRLEKMNKELREVVKSGKMRGPARKKTARKVVRRRKRNNR